MKVGRKNCGIFLLIAWIFPLHFEGEGVQAAPVTGRILEVDGVTPIGGALVTLQATFLQTTTAADGTYSLEVGAGSGLVIVGARKGYFNTSATVSAGATGVEIRLPRVPQDNDASYAFVIPEDCGSCHPDQYSEWLGTPMAKAGFNTWAHDTYSGTGTAGGMGGFVYVRDSEFAATNPASECAACHQPEHWLNNLFTGMVGPNDPPSAAAGHGVSCEVCHKIADVDVSKINFPGLFPGAVTVTRPAGPSYHQVQYGLVPDADFSVPSLMRGSYQPQLAVEVCAACHQDKNDPAEDHSYTGVISEPTYTEWIDSAYSDPNSPHYATCIECHMPATDRTTLCNVIFPPLVRPAGSIRSHRILGTTPEFLENSVELALETEVVGDELAVNVRITNNGVGHHVPTGVTVRNMILLVEAWQDGNNPLTQPLPRVTGSVVHALGGVGNPALGYYAGLPGRLYAKLIHDGDGNAPTFFTDAAGIVFDNRIPALATDETDYRFALPLEGGLIRVRARVLYRRAFRPLVDAKQWLLDGHGNPLVDLAPPHYGHLMEMAERSVDVGPMGGACCVPGGSCEVVSESDCLAESGAAWAGVGTDCVDADQNGVADVCGGAQSIPTVSEWGLVVLGLVLLTLGKLVFGGRRFWVAA